MQTNMQKLKGKIIESGYTQDTFASAIGVSNSTLIRKIKSCGISFTIGEAHKIAHELNLSAKEATEIFFTEKSHKCDITNCAEGRMQNENHSS